MVGLPSPRRRAPGRAATTTAGRRQAPTQAGRDRRAVPRQPPGRWGRLGWVGRDSPRAVAPERLVGGRVRPNYSPQIAPVKLRLAPQRDKNSSFAVRGLLRGGGHASTGRSTARSDSCFSIHLGRGGVNSSLRRAAKSFKRNWVAPHPSQKRRKHKNGVAAPGWRPSSAAAHCPCSSDAARRRGDRGLSLEPHC